MVFSGTKVLALLLLALHVECGEKIFMLIAASLSVCFTHRTGLSLDGTLNGLFKVMNNEVMLSLLFCCFKILSQTVEWTNCQIIWI